MISESLQVNCIVCRPGAYFHKFSTEVNFKWSEFILNNLSVTIRCFCGGVEYIRLGIADMINFGRLVECVASFFSRRISTSIWLLVFSAQILYLSHEIYERFRTCARIPTDFEYCPRLIEARKYIVILPRMRYPYSYYFFDELFPENTNTKLFKYSRYGRRILWADAFDW